MNTKTINTSFSNAATGTSVEVLQQIDLEEKNIAIYHRDIQTLEEEVSNFLKEKIAFEATGSVEELTSQLEASKYNNNDKYPALIKDICFLLQTFQTLSSNSSFRLLLTSVNTNMCRRFHTDVNDLRLLCTYSGPGTLWLLEENVNRDALDNAKSNDDIVKNDADIQQAATGDVVILKGAIYPKPNTKAIVHRSPAIEETGETRLMLRIDTNDFLKTIQ